MTESSGSAWRGRSRYRSFRKHWPYVRFVLRQGAFAGAAGVVALAFFLAPAFNSLEGARFTGVIAHTATRPYAGRVLLPFLARGLSRLFDPTALLTQHARDGFTAFAGAHQVGRPDVPTLAFVIVLSVLALRGAMSAYAALLRRVGKTTEEATILLTVLSTLSLRMFFDFGGHFFYDPVTLCLAAALFYFLEVGRPALFAVCLVLAAVNKETAFVFVPVGAFVVASRTRSFAATVRWTIAHAALWGVAWGAVLVGRGLVANTSSHDNFLRDYATGNLAHFVAAETWMDFRNWLALLFAGWLVFRRFGERPLVLRAGLIAALLLLAGYVRGSLYGEARVFYEVIWPVFMLAAMSLAELTASPRRHGWVRLRQGTALVTGTLALAVIDWAAIVSALR
jgi:hypothetical protein